MKVKFLGRTELRGHVYKRGEVANISDEEYAERPDCFAKIGEAEEKKDAESEDSQGQGKPLTKAQLMAKLDELNVPYGPRDTAEKLRDRLAEAVDNPPLSTNGAE
jgi:hypothetical protein